MNYDQQCRLGCAFCYAPMAGGAPDFHLLRKILEHAAELGFRVVTLSGGDPLDYSGTRPLIRSAHQMGLEVHIDSNGLGLTEADYDLPNSCVSLLGLPLDGSTAIVHDQVRGRPGHFDLVVAHLEALEACCVETKVNTVVVRQNLHDVPNLHRLVSALHVPTWSVYEFMHLGPSMRSAKDFEVGHDEFESIALAITRSPLSPRVEIGRERDRRESYLFVGLDGIAYTHSGGMPPSYVSLGSFLEGPWESRFDQLAQRTVTRGARARYRSLCDSDPLAAAQQGDRADNTPRSS